jgi:hypothetical protein
LQQCLFFLERASLKQGKLGGTLVSWLVEVEYAQQLYSIPLRKNRLVLQGGQVLLIPKTPGKRSVKFPTEDPKSGWTIDSKRVGSIGIKVNHLNIVIFSFIFLFLAWNDNGLG